MVAGDEDEDLRELWRGQRRYRLRATIVLGACGLVLALIGFGSRRWALDLDAAQAASNVRITLPRWVVAMSWGTVVAGAICLLIALVTGLSALKRRI
jgi:hypothetical protein